MGQSIQEWTKYICERQPLNNLNGYGLLKAVWSVEIYLKVVFHNLLHPFLNTLSQMSFLCNENGTANFFIWCILKTANQKINLQNSIIWEYRAGFIE